MADMCIKQGARLVLASVPVAYDPADVKKAREADPTFDPEYFEKDLAAFASSQNIAFVELGSEFRDAAARGESLQWTHWSYAGHALAGRLIAARLATIDTRPWSRM